MEILEIPFPSLDKVPRVGGSHGERYRERQLQLQLPKQDLSHKYCTHLEPTHQVLTQFKTDKNECLSIDHQIILPLED